MSSGSGELLRFDPEDLPEPELERFLADICHEMATEARSTVRRLTPSVALTPG